jgi:dihydrofolate reductase
VSTVYFTATTLDGYLADERDSLHWLFKQDHDPDGPMSPNAFTERVGAICMGATTYAWLLAHVESWPYEQPCWVFTHRDLGDASGDVRFVQGDVRPVHEEMVGAADDRDVWVMGGGDLAAQFAECGLLEQVLVSVAPVTLGAGRPLLPRPFDLRLVDVERNRAFACLTYEVVGPLSRGPANPGDL